MTDAVLTLNKATIRFGGLVAVNELSFQVERGGLVGLIGPNGAGKTTVFNLITGVYMPTSGAIQLEGKSLNRLRPHQIARLGIARTFQNIRLFSGLSPLENVMTAGYLRHRSNLLGAALRAPGALTETAEMRDAALDLLERFGLQDVAHARARDLPYGMQRRLEIARALATQPKLLLLDEPAAGMNPQESEALMHDILKLQTDYGISILLIEHDMRFVMGMCRHIVVLDYGQAIAEGTPEVIRNDPKVIEAYLGEPM